MMLASTIQISRYGRPRTRHMPRSAAWAFRSSETTSTHALVPSGPNSVPTQPPAAPAVPPPHPKEERRTRPG